MANVADEGAEPNGAASRGGGDGEFDGELPPVAMRGDGVKGNGVDDADGAVGFDDGFVVAPRLAGVQSGEVAQLAGDEGVAIKGGNPGEVRVAFVAVVHADEVELFEGGAVGQEPAA